MNLQKNYGLRIAEDKIGAAPKKISEHHGKKVKAINELCVGALGGRSCHMMFGRCWNTHVFAWEGWCPLALCVSGLSVAFSKWFDAVLHLAQAVILNI